MVKKYEQGEFLFGICAMKSKISKSRNPFQIRITDNSDS